jgi:hypothetical protein
MDLHRPTDNVYLKDEKGNFLSIAEVRERLVKRLPIVLNPTANYHDVPTKKEEYLDQFMGEHLYRMICPVTAAITRKQGTESNGIYRAITLRKRRATVYHVRIRHTLTRNRYIVTIPPTTSFFGENHRF